MLPPVRFISHFAGNGGSLGWLRNATNIWHRESWNICSKLFSVLAKENVEMFQATIFFNYFLLFIFNAGSISIFTEIFTELDDDYMFLGWFMQSKIVVAFVSLNILYRDGNLAPQLVLQTFKRIDTAP